MHKRIDSLWLVLTVGFATAAMAQTGPVQSPVTKYDGTYAFVSSTKVHETYLTTGTTRLGHCPDLRPRGPFSVVNGHAKFNLQEGEVGPHGELAMRFLTPAPFGKCGGCSPGLEVTSTGGIDESGTVRVRRMDYYCSWDLIWQKISK
jgi:hypothetical protein